MVQIQDLADQTLDKSRANEFLYCYVCCAEHSANKGDYFMAPDDNHVFQCCGQPMILATKTITIVGIK